MANSIYQSLDYKKALVAAGEKIVEIEPGVFGLEIQKPSPLSKTKKILEFRGDYTLPQLQKIKELSKKYFYVKVMPCVLTKDLSAFDQAKFGKTSNYTILIDLTKEKEELWKNLEKKSARWGVKFAEKNKLSFEPITSTKDLKVFYKLYKETAKKGGFKPEPEAFVATLANTNSSELFLIKKGKEILAGGLLLVDKSNNYSILDLTASSEKGLKLQAMPFLYWNLLLYSKANSLNFFDLGGYDKEAKKGDKTYNINKFKERFGGEIVEQPVYSPNKKYTLLRYFFKLFKNIKGFFKRK